MTPYEYIQALKTGQAIPSLPQGLFGRIIHGTSDQDLEVLSPKANRRLVMVLGEDGLLMATRLSAYEMLSEIGYHAPYMQYLLERNYRFQMLAFTNDQPLLATWPAIMQAVCGAYPEVADKIEPYLSVFERTKYPLFEDEAGYEFGSVDRTGPSDERFMTLERFLRCHGSALEARAFLYFTVRLFEHFRGDGYTSDRPGHRGLREYIVPNQTLAQLGNFAVCDLTVQEPEEIPNERKE